MLWRCSTIPGDAADVAASLDAAVHDRSRPDQRVVETLIGRAEKILDAVSDCCVAYVPIGAPGDEWTLAQVCSRHQKLFNKREK